MGWGLAPRICVAVRCHPETSAQPIRCIDRAPRPPHHCTALRNSVVGSSCVGEPSATRPPIVSFRDQRHGGRRYCHYHGSTRALLRPLAFPNTIARIDTGSSPAREHSCIDKAPTISQRLADVSPWLRPRHTSCKRAGRPRRPLLVEPSTRRVRTLRSCLRV